MFCICLHNFPATLDHKPPGLCEHSPINSKIQHKARQSPLCFLSPNTAAPRDAITASQRKPIRNSIFPVEGKLRALIHTMKASCMMLQQAAEAAGARDAEPLRSAALAPMGRAPLGSSVSWAMVTPSGHCLRRGQRPTEGKTCCRPPNLATLKNQWGFLKCICMYTHPTHLPIESSSTVTNTTNDLPSFNFKSHAFFKQTWEKSFPEVLLA